MTTQAGSTSRGIGRGATAAFFAALLALAIAAAMVSGPAAAQQAGAPDEATTEEPSGATAPEPGAPSGGESAAGTTGEEGEQGPAELAPTTFEKGDGRRGDKTGGGDKGGKKKKDRPKRQSQPNIISFLTDDQAPRTVIPEAMPELHDLLIADGTSFSDFIVTTPLCCPSRATGMTGQYGHNNGVLRNVYPDLLQKRNVLPSWLKYAGYNTAHVGKFLNGYEQGDSGPTAVAPGWDLWFTQLEKRRYYNWQASKNGKVKRYGSRDNDHATAVTAEFASRWAGRLARKRDPFYMQVDFFAPHTSTGRDRRCAGSPVPEARDEFRFAGYEVPRAPSFNEEDVSDKPSFIRDRPQFTEEEIVELDRRYRCTLEALYGVDRGIAKVYRKVRQAGELKDTVFIFSSDNGVYSGEHRIIKGKPYAYEENINMPLTIVVPPRHRDGVTRVPSSGAPTANIDLAPTILDLADADPCRTKRICRTMDGRSLMPLIEGTGRFPDTRPIRIEIGNCVYEGVRVTQEVYLEHSRAATEGCEPAQPGFTEHYDTVADPFQLDNLAADEFSTPERRERQRGLESLMTKLATCAGIARRDERVPGVPFCK